LGADRGSDPERGASDNVASLMLLSILQESAGVLVSCFVGPLRRLIAKIATKLTTNMRIGTVTQLLR
jgi:hypothetical protein